MRRSVGRGAGSSLSELVKGPSRRFPEGVTEVVLYSRTIPPIPITQYKGPFKCDAPKGEGCKQSRTAKRRDIRRECQNFEHFALRNV